MRKFLTLVFVLMPLIGARAATPVASTDPSAQFAQANQFFEKGDSEKALEIYQALVAQGFESAELYYNMGNVFYRKGERGKAVLWYERALRLAPRDSDIQFNLSLARSHIKDEEDSFLRRVFLYFTGNELSVFLSVLVWFFFGLLGARMLGWIRSETWPGVTLWFTGLLLAVSATWFGVALSFAHEPLAVVVAPPGEVRNGPGADYAVGFTIPEGSKVVVLNRRPDWTQVGVPNQGLKGWMPNSDLEAIAPTNFSG